jgi:hypothetical protein
MAISFGSTLARIFITPYRPQDNVRSFMERAQTQQAQGVTASVAVLDAHESAQMFGVPMARRGIQPVHLRIENQGKELLRLQLVRTDPNYYTPLEAAAANHFSIARRIYAFGIIAHVIMPFLLLLAPLKLITAYLANRRMDDFFRKHAFPLRPIPPGGTSEGFIFTPVDVGTKVVHVCLQQAGNLIDQLEAEKSLEPDVALTFSISVPGISADYLRLDFDSLVPPDTFVDCELPALVERLAKMPPATCNRKDTRQGDPVNLVVVGPFENLLSSFIARWDESETITLATCWKTMRSCVFGSEYRYSPVSPLYLFGRSQDVALQRSRRSINERLHLRLWLTPLRYQKEPVWVGQVSRDIGVRFTPKTWNLTTHRIDPDVDEARDYVIEDLLHARRVLAAGYVDGSEACDAKNPRHNLTGDIYFTDGRRAVVLLAPDRTAAKFVAWE